jgi:hypothetical protein
MKTSFIIRKVKYVRTVGANDFGMFRRTENMLFGKYVNLTIARVIKENEIVVACGSWETKEVHRGFCWGDLRERDDLEDLGIDEKIILKCIFKKWNEEA